MSSRGFARWVGTAAAVALLGGAGPADAQLTSPSHYAITNARIITGTGQTIDGGTIVMKDGLITAVGSNVDVPADAWTIDGTGMTVYPGLIDAMSNVAVPESMRRPAGGGGFGFGAGGPGGRGGQDVEQAPHSWGPEDRPGTFSWLNAADELNTEDDDIETWRNAGFTTAIVSPERGFFPGQAAVINLATAGRPREMVVRTPVALRVNLNSGPGFPGYPGSLMGAIAYVKQAFFDAAHYGQAWRIYEESPSGLERPEWDRALEPLRMAQETQMRVLYPGNWAREVKRVFDIARQTGTNPVVYGAQEGYRVADELAAARVPVLLNASWPEPPRNANPDQDYPLSTLRFRDRAPTTPAEFERAGVQFAFYSGGADPSKLMRNLRKAIAMGLSPEAALHALTMAPAEIFGVSEVVGSLQEGKIANVMVTDGDLFTRGTNVKMVFVDGRKFEVPEAKTAGRPGRRGPGARDADTEAEEEEEEEAEENFAPPIPMTVDRGIIDPADVTIIRNATVMTVSNGTMENTDVLIRDGKIAEIGQNLSVPNGAKEIDATGKYVMPGIIDAHSHLAADAINEGSVSVSAMVGIKDVLNPDQIGIYRALAGGVTSANILHGSANPVGGRNAVVKFRWGSDAEGMYMEGAPEGIKFALGENTKRDRNPDRYPATRMGVQDVIRQAFVEAQQYRKDWQQYDAARARGETVIPPRVDLKLQTMAEILEGTRLVHAHSYRADEILQLIRLADEFGFRIATFQHVLEGYKVADEIAAHGAGASTFSDWWGYKVEAYEAIPYNAALMTERGVTASINSDSGEEIRHLNQEAAKSMKWGGLTEDQALALVTLNPAKQLGVADHVGSLEVGKDADIVIFNNHPLSVYGVVEQTIIDGQVYFDRQVDLQRRDALEAEKKALMDKEKGSAQRPRVTTDDAGQEELN